MSKTIQADLTVMHETNVLFSADEMGLMKDSAWILTKNAVISKWYQAMGHLAGRMKAALINRQLPEALIRSNAKISRGENYLSLPYVMMDCPKIFGRDHVLAIRTFFWWGRFCSITLHAKGIYKPLVIRNLSATTCLRQSRFCYAIAGDEWNHDVMSDDYTPLPKLFSAAFLTDLRGSPFIKLSSKLDFEQWNIMEEQLYELFLMLIGLCEESA